jgi:heme-degrading monooxygenase HmoA
MIVRTWRASAAPDRRRLYPQHFTADVLPKLRGIPGFLGAYLLERETDAEVEFVVQTLWASADAIARFAGPRPEVAVVEPEAAAALLRYDATVTHHVALVAAGEGAASHAPSGSRNISS